MCQWEANRNPQVGYRIGLSPTRAPFFPSTSKPGLKSAPVQLSTKWLEMNEVCQQITLTKNTMADCGSWPNGVVQLFQHFKSSDWRSFWATIVAMTLSQKKHRRQSINVGIKVDLIAKTITSINYYQFIH